MSPPLVITQWIHDLPATQTVAAWKILFFSCLALATGAAIRYSAARARPLWLQLAIALSLLSVWIHQARWQLLGFTDTRFVGFLRRYDHRPWAAEAFPKRGRILDANGTVIAEDDPSMPGRRLYPLGPAAAHVIGFFDRRYGLSGVERAADAELSGRTLMQTNSVRHIGYLLLRRDAAQGRDVRLTIWAPLQKMAFEKLAGRRGAIVALEPSTGAIRALVSSPSFHPDAPTKALKSDPDEAPMLNRALRGLYPPGSTFKIVTAGIALEAGHRPILDCPASGFVPQRGMKPVRDHEFYAAQRAGRVWTGHGRLSMGDAFARSSNVYFSQLGYSLSGPEARLLFERAGLLSPMNVYGTTEATLSTAPAVGLAEWHRSAATRALMAIGQGPLLVTPMHLAILTAAVANDGMAMRPRLDADRSPEPLARLFSAATARELREMMREVVTRGTGRAAHRPNLAIAGKTGTAQNPRGADHAWFAGFAPAASPSLVVVVVVEHGGSGGRVAAPIAADLFEFVHRSMGSTSPADARRP